MAIDVDFRALLVARINDPAVPVEQDNVSEDQPAVRVWYQRRNETTGLHLDGGKGLTEANFDVEVHALDIAKAQTLAGLLRGHESAGGLNAYRGAMGSMEVLGIFVEDADDDYEPKGLDADDGYHVAALSVQIVTG